MRRLLTSFFLLVPTLALATPALTNAPTTMREAPSAHSRVVQSIPANAQIDIEGCGRYWCNASWRNIDGFVPANVVSAGGPPVYNAAPPPVVFGPPVVFAPFGWGYGWHRHEY